MSPQRRTALVSVGAAGALIAIKLAAGIGSGSLGLVSEALHSGTDLVAALLTFFALGRRDPPGRRRAPVRPRQGGASRRACRGGDPRPGQRRVAGLAVARLAGWVESEVDAAWWAFAAAGLVIVIDLTRTLVSLRGARRYSSPALLANALHFGGDLAGTLAVLGGLAAARAGWPAGDSIAALFVAALVLLAAGRLMRTNVDVLMDRSPADGRGGGTSRDRRRRARSRPAAAPPPPGRPAATSRTS